LHNIFYLFIYIPRLFYYFPCARTTESQPQTISTGCFCAHYAPAADAENFCVSLCVCPCILLLIPHINIGPKNLN